MSHTARTPAALGRWKRPSARLTAVVAVGIALALQVVPPSGSADAASLSASTVHAVVPVTGVDLQVLMTGPTEAVPGSTFTDTILVTNAGSDPATGFTFDLAAPVAGATYAISDPDVTCNASWHCTLADLAAGSQKAVQLAVTTAAPLRDGSQVRPVVQVATTATDADASNNSAAAATVLSSAGQLVVSVQRTSAATMLPGQRATFRITLTNKGPNVAIAPEVLARPLAVPASTHQTGSASGAICHAEGTDGLWSCLWPNVPAGQSRVMTFAATAGMSLTPGPFPLLVEAVSDNSDGDADATAATVLDTNNRATDVSVTTYTTPKVKAGKRGDWKITVTNHGPYRAHDVKLSVTLPKGFYWKDVKGRAQLLRKLRTQTGDIGTLEVGQSWVLPGWFRYSMGNTLTFTSKVTHSDPDSKKANNSSTATTKITGAVVQTVTTSTTSDDPVVSTTTTSSGSTSSADTDVDGFKYDGSEQAIDSSSTSSSSGAKEVLADTGGPALRLPLLGFTLVLLGAVSTARSRPLRPAPRHRAWVSPYA